MVYKFILFSIIGITITHKAIGTECVRCVECSFSPPEIQTLIPEIEKKCINPKCIKATSETNATNVSFGPCPNNTDDQRINRCGSLRGSVKFSMPPLGEATVTFYLRDCFAVNKNTEFGCYTDQNTLNDQKAILVKQFEDDLKSLNVQVGDIQNGEFCIKNDGTNKSCTLMFSSVWLLIMLMLAPLIV
ncbi:unnamed protein product [Mytilus edulis]|uniref:Uncharacterized protein n=1 Tax=Mytilus edulis TaxID=6550 RepID=A0A8S3VJG5_MYTED|nr:unnamed protein product [Mytilus edulis]